MNCLQLHFKLKLQGFFNCKLFICILHDTSKIYTTIQTNRQAFVYVKSIIQRTRNCENTKSSACQKKFPAMLESTSANNFIQKKNIFQVSFQLILNMLRNSGKHTQKSDRNCKQARMFTLRNGIFLKFPFVKVTCELTQLFLIYE